MLRVPDICPARQSAGQSATLQTDTSASTTAGLKQNMAFTVEGRWDLAIPEDVRDQYGIRLSDNTPANTGAFIFDDPTFAPQSRRFYRFRVK